MIMRTDFIKKSLAGELFALRPTELDALAEFINSGAISEYKGTGLDSVSYEKIENVAIISIDGAMAKKGYTWLCTSVFGYNDIIAKINEAEKDPEVGKIIFSVDSPGGAVAGVSQLYDRVKNSTKETVTYYDNIGASAAIYGFIGADKIYASPSTVIGSIGVLALVQEERDDGTTVLVSSRAKNKICQTKEECLARLQALIDKHEDMFFAAIEESRGFTPDRTREVFNDGGVIFADEAEWNGFIDGVMSIRQLLEKEI